MLYGLVVSGARAAPLFVLMGTSFVLPAVQFGALANMVAVVTLGIGIAEGGLDSSASLLIGAGRPAGEVVRSLLSVRVVLALLLATTVLPALLLPIGLAHGAALIGLAGVVLVLASVAATARVKVRVASPRREMLFLTIDRLLSSVPLVAGLALGATASALALLFLAGQALGSLATIVMARPPRAGRSLAGDLVRQALPFIVSTVAANITWRVGVISLGMAGASEQAGHLAAAIYPVQALTMVSAASAPLILIKGNRDGGNGLRPSLGGVVALLGLTGLVSATLGWGVDYLPVSPEVVRTLAVLVLVLPAALANPLVGAGIRVDGRARLVAGAAMTGSTVAVLVAFATTRAPYQAVGIVLAEVTVLTTMLLLRSHRMTPTSRVGLS